MSKKNKILFSVMVLPLMTACSVDLTALHAIEHKAEKINRYEQVALKLAKENRELYVEVKRLEFEIEKLKQDKYYGSKESASEHGAVAVKVPMRRVQVIHPQNMK